MQGYKVIIDELTGFINFLSRATGYGVILWLLAFTFAWSSSAKLRKPLLAAMAIVDFGVTNKVNITFGRILGAFEGILAIALALKVYPRVTLTITAMLLWVFGSLIFRSLLLGKDFACFCFGDIDSNLSRWTLLRTLALASLATTVAYFPTPDNLHTSLEADVMQAIVAISPLGIVVLISQIVRLLRMEVNPQFNSKERKMKTNK